MASETFKQAKAFDLYYAMGDDRSYDAVASRIGVSKQSIYKWSKQNNWQQRIAERDAKNAEQIYKQTDDDMVKTALQYREVAKASIGAYIKKLKNGELDIKTPADFIKLVELDMKLAGIIENITEEKSETSTVIRFNITKK